MVVADGKPTWEFPHAPSPTPSPTRRRGVSEQAGTMASAWHTHPARSYLNPNIPPFPPQPPIPRPHFLGRHKELALFLQSGNVGLLPGQTPIELVLQLVHALVDGVSAEEAVLQPPRCPLAEIHAQNGIAPVSDRDNVVEIAARAPPADAADTLHANYREFLGRCFPRQFADCVDVLQMQPDIVRAAPEQDLHLVLCAIRFRHPAARRAGWLRRAGKRLSRSLSPLELRVFLLGNSSSHVGVPFTSK